MIISIVLSTINSYADEIDNIIPYVITVESSGNPHAVSGAGCIGMMQISPIVLREYRDTEQMECRWIEGGEACFYFKDAHTIGDLFDVKINIKIGEWYLRRLRDHYLKDNYTMERMLSAYNGGPTRMRRLLREGKDWWDMPRESVRYTKKVMRLYNAN